MSKSLITACAIVGLLFSGAISAEEGHKPEGGKAGAEAHAKPLYGTVVSTGDKQLVISVKAKGEKEGKEQTIKTDEKTVVSIEGDDKKALTDLKAGQRVQVTVEHDVATKIEVKAPMKKHDGEKKEGEKEKKEKKE